MKKTIKCQMFTATSDRRNTAELPLDEHHNLPPLLVVFEGALYLRRQTEPYEYDRVNALSADGTTALPVDAWPEDYLALAPHIRLAMANAYAYLTDRALADAQASCTCAVTPAGEPCASDACREADGYAEHQNALLDTLDMAIQRDAMDLLLIDGREGERARHDCRLALDRWSLPIRGYTVKMFGAGRETRGQVGLADAVLQPGCREDRRS